MLLYKIFEIIISRDNINNELIVFFSHEGKNLLMNLILFKEILSFLDKNQRSNAKIKGINRLFP